MIRMRPNYRTEIAAIESLLGSRHIGDCGAAATETGIGCLAPAGVNRRDVLAAITVGNVIMLAISCPRHQPSNDAKQCSKRLLFEASYSTKDHSFCGQARKAASRKNEQRDGNECAGHTTQCDSSS